MTHDVKLDSEFFDKVGSGIKTFEARYDDRGYAVGDVLLLREWRNGMYTGRVLEAVITDIYRGEYAREGYCIISFQLSFPTTAKIPVSVYMELYNLYLAVCRERDCLKGV